MSETAEVPVAPLNPAPSGEQKPWQAIASFFWELIKVFLVAVIIIVPIRYFLVQPFFVRGASMEDSFSDGEYLIIDELSYRFREPTRGEVVVFRFPNNHDQFFIKRIIGLPGDTVRVAGGRVFIRNDEFTQEVTLDESGYLSETTRTGGTVTVTLGADEYFVLGDNRAQSSDSRSWGALDRDEIIGRAWIRAFPFNSLGIIETARVGLLAPF